jgi:hypothetical protein
MVAASTCLGRLPPLESGRGGTSFRACCLAFIAMISGCVMSHGTDQAIASAAVRAIIPRTGATSQDGSFEMHTFAAAGAGFLLAVLWFDLMFDVQTRKDGGEVLPPQVLASISAYYRRVTTEAYPMNRLVAVVMLLTLAAICVEIVQGQNPWWIGWGSILLAGGGFVPTMMRTVPNARRLGTSADSPQEQSRLARAVCRDHMLSFARMSVVLGLQLMAR